MDTLYISDLDGTLLGTDSLLTPDTRALLSEAIRAGAAFTVATARTPATVAPIFEGIELPLPAIVMTGAAMWNQSDGSYSDVRYIPSDTVKKLLEVYRDQGLPTFVYTLHDNHIDIYHPGPLSPQETAFRAQRLGSPFKSFHDIAEAGEVPLNDVILLFAMREQEPVVRTYDAILRAGLDCNPLHYHDTYGPESELMEVFGPGATKGEAVERLKSITGARRTVVFGDNINDLPMMRRADVAVAVENAVDEVKREADIVIGPNTDDSVARFILEDFRKL